MPISTLPTVLISTPLTMPSSVIGLWISGSFTRESAVRMASSVGVTRSMLGARRKRARLGAFPVGETSDVAICLVLQQQRFQVLHLAAEVVPGGDVTHGDAQRGNLPGEELGVRLGLLGTRTVFLERDPVAVLLPVLRQQDQRGGIGGLRGEGQVEQDERVGVEPQCDGSHVDGDPDDDEDRLDEQVATGTEETRDALADLADRVEVEVDLEPFGSPWSTEALACHRVVSHGEASSCPCARRPSPCCPTHCPRAASRRATV